MSGQVPVSPQRPPWALAPPAPSAPSVCLCAGVEHRPLSQPLLPAGSGSPGLEGPRRARSASPAALSGTALPARCSRARETGDRDAPGSAPPARSPLPLCVSARWAPSEGPVTPDPTRGRAGQRGGSPGEFRSDRAHDFCPRGPEVRVHPGSPPSRGSRRPLIPQRSEEFNVPFKFSAFLKRIMQHSVHPPVKLRTVICYLGLPPSTKDVFLVLCYHKKEADTITALPGATERNEQPDTRGHTAGGGGAGAAGSGQAAPQVRSPGGHQAAGDQTTTATAEHVACHALEHHRGAPPPTSPPPTSPPPTSPPPTSPPPTSPLPVPPSACASRDCSSV